MTPHVFRHSALAIATVFVLSSLVIAQSAHELFQQALSKERAEGNLQEAIKLYQRVVDTASSDHALAAKALLQLGRCYEQLGNTEARNAYERLIARYPDQTDAVAQAKARLASLVRTAPASSTPAAMTVQPLPDLSNLDTELVSVAPDGTKAIVIDYHEDANGELAVYDFAKKQKRRVADSKFVVDHAVWSPDAQRVVFMEATWPRDASALRVTTLDGRSSVVHRSEGGVTRPVGWTPDGGTLVIQVERPDKTVAVGTLPAGGGRFTPLRSFGWSANRGGGFRLSPDGRFVAYEQGEVGVRDIHVMSLDGRESYRITDHPADDFAPLWSPDSRHLAFMSSRSGTVSLWAVEVKAGEPVGQTVKLMDGMQSADLVDWIGRGIFFGQTTNTSDLYTVKVDPVEGRATDTLRQVPYLRTGRNITPMWSPDGGRLAFVSSSATEPNRRSVVVMTADGGETREFLIPTTSYQNPQSPYDLRWFGDGRGLGFSGVDARGGKAVFRLMLQTGEWDVVDLPIKQLWTRIDWNRDGTAFYFARHTGSGEANTGIFERGMQGDAERLVYRLPERVNNIRSLQFSPDRKLLAFLQVGRTAVNSLHVGIIVLDVETGEARTVLEDTPTDQDDLSRTINLVSWSPSGDLLVWRPRPGGGPAETLLVPVNGGAPRSIEVPTLGPAARPLFAKWSPTGSMVIVRESRSNKAFVIENPLAAVRPATARR